jgi:hypothetical protein
LCFTKQEKEKKRPVKQKKELPAGIPFGMCTEHRAQSTERYERNPYVGITQIRFYGSKIQYFLSACPAVMPQAPLFSGGAYHNRENKATEILQ